MADLSATNEVFDTIKPSGSTPGVQDRGLSIYDSTSHSTFSIAPDVTRGLVPPSLLVSFIKKNKTNFNFDFDLLGCLGGSQRKLLC